MRSFISVIRSKHFILSFSVIFFVSLMITFYFISLSITQKERQEADFMHQQSMSIVRSINDLIMEIERTTMQLSFLSTVNDIGASYDRSAIRQYITLQNELLPFCSNEFIHTIEVFFMRSDSILSASRGLYTRANYYDSQFLQALGEQNNQQSWYFNRQEYLSLFEDQPLLTTYARKFPYSGALHYGYLMIHIEQNRLYDYFDSIPLDENTGFHLLYHDQLIFSSSPDYLEILLDDSEGLSSQDLSVQRMLTTQMSASTSHLDVMIFRIQPSITQTILNSINTYLLNLLSFVLIGLILSYAYSSIMLKPIQKLMKQFNGSEHNNVSKKQLVYNEFDHLETAMNQMLSHNKQIEKLMQENKSILQEKLILDLLWGKSDFSFKLSANKNSDSSVNLFEYDLNLTEKCFTVLLIRLIGVSDITTRTMRDQMLLYCKNLVQNQLSFLGSVYGVLIDNNKIAFLINSSDDLVQQRKNDLIRHSIEIHNLVKTDYNLTVLFSYGNTVSSWTKINQTYNQLNRILDFPIQFDENPVFFSEESEKSGISAFALIFPRNEIVDLILEKNTHEIEKVLFEFNSKINMENENEATILSSFSYIVTTVYVDLWERNVNLHYDSLSKNLKSLASVKEDYLASLIELLQQLVFEISQLNSDTQNDNIEKVIDYVSEHYMEDINVAQISDYVHLNSIYLNRIFKLTVGKTLSEYLNFYRIEKAKTHLQNSSENITDIGTMVGYEDYRRFARYFRKFEKCTPSQYRQAIFSKNKEYKS